MFYKKLNTFEYIKKKAKENPKFGFESSCYVTATDIIYLLAGCFEPLLIKSIQTFNDNDYEINKKLFNQNSEPEHLVFEINIGANIFNGHTFVVEKKGDGKTSFWRVYQSLWLKLRLCDWLESNTYRGGNTYLNNLIKKFGHGKKLSCTEIKELIEIFFKNSLIPRGYFSRIKMYEVKPINYKKAAIELRRLTNRATRVYKQPTGIVNCAGNKAESSITNSIQKTLQSTLLILEKHHCNEESVVNMVYKKLQEFDKKCQKEVDEKLQNIVIDYAKNFYKSGVTDIKKELYYGVWIKENPARFYSLVQWTIYTKNVKKIILQHTRDIECLSQKYL